MTHLSFIIFATVALHDLERAKPEKRSKCIHLQSLPVIHALGKINHCRRKVFFVNGLIGIVKNLLDTVNCMCDICLQLGIF